MVRSLAGPSCRWKPVVKHVGSFACCFPLESDSLDICQALRPASRKEPCASLRSRDLMLDFGGSERMRWFICAEL